PRRPDLRRPVDRADHSGRSRPAPPGGGGAGADGGRVVRGGPAIVPVPDVRPVGAVLDLPRLPPAALEPELCDRAAGWRAGGPVAGLAADPAATAVVDLPRQVRRCATLGIGVQP